MVFGSESHQFHVNEPLSENSVKEFETRHKIVLPADYRGFLIHVGNGGAGPSYGLFPLGEQDGGTGDGSLPWSENDGLVGTLALPFPHTRSWNDLTGMPKFDAGRLGDWKYEDEYGLQKNAWELAYFSTTHVNGAIPICHLGCALCQWLVIARDESGHVWDDRREDLEGLRPSKMGDQQRVPFLQWYRSWLENAMRQLE